MIHHVILITAQSHNSSQLETANQDSEYFLIFSSQQKKTVKFENIVFDHAWWRLMTTALAPAPAWPIRDSSLSANVSQPMRSSPLSSPSSVTLRTFSYQSLVCDKDLLWKTASTDPLPLLPQPDRQVCPGGGEAGLREEDYLSADQSGGGHHHRVRREQKCPLDHQHQAQPHLVQGHIIFKLYTLHTSYKHVYVYFINIIF